LIRFAHNDNVTAVITFVLIEVDVAGHPRDRLILGFLEQLLEFPLKEPGLFLLRFHRLLEPRLAPACFALQLLGRSLKTTNCLESIMAQVGQRTDKIDHWRRSDQKQRWVATALLDIEPRLRRIKGYRHLPLLRAALQRETTTRAGNQAQVA